MQVQKLYILPPPTSAHAPAACAASFATTAVTATTTASTIVPASAWFATYFTSTIVTTTSPSATLSAAAFTLTATASLPTGWTCRWRCARTDRNAQHDRHTDSDSSLCGGHGDRWTERLCSG